jgi:hypothetical protein
MTGGEIASGAAVAKAAADAAAKALKTSDTEIQTLDELSRNSPVMAIAAEEYAKRVALKQAVVRRLYQALARMVGVKSDYFDTRFADDLARKTAHLADEDLVEPAGSIAFPAMQGLSYSTENPALKDMYLNLLAAAIDGRRHTVAHPAFAEIIKQLSPAEAEVLLAVLAAGHLAIVEVRARDEGTSWDVVTRNIMDAHHPRTGAWLRADEASMWLDNWARLGLVEVRWDAIVAGVTAYDWCKEHPDTRGIEAEPESILDDQPDGIYLSRGLVHVTDFGRRFVEAVSVDPQAPHVIVGEVDDGAASADEVD